MKCSKCGFDNPDGFKFCGSCGNTLILKCPNCNTELPPGFKFCGNCGTKVDSDNDDEIIQPVKEEKAPKSIPKAEDKKISKKEAERRNVTVLFLDISGFTAMSEKLDPEEVREIMNDCFKELTSVIDKYEGTVDKFIGDAIMALFGAPVAHENDPERAIRAAIEMQESLSTFSNKLKIRLGLELRMRIGINTGPVVAGDVGSESRSDYTVMGDTVNLASRLEHAAPVGGILISSTTYQQNINIFKFNKIEPITVKGKEKPIEVYEVVGLAEEDRTKSFATKIPMVSRDRELGYLIRLSRELYLDKKPSIVTITGEAGIGKDRLLDELFKKVDPDEIQTLSARALTYARSGSYWLFIELIKEYFDIKEFDDDADIEKKLIHKFKTLKDINTDDILPYIGYLLSVKTIEEKYKNKLKYLSPDQLREQIFISVRKFLFSISSKKSLIVVLNDFHASDNLSINLTSFLLDFIENHPIMLCISSRISDRDNINELLDKIKNIKSIESLDINLGKLPESFCKELLKYYLPPNVELPEPVNDLILEKSDGVPFFIEEITKMLIELGYFEIIDNKLKIETVDLDLLQIPGTLQGLMMSRFDLLQERDRITGQDSSVIGRTYSYKLLNEIGKDELSADEINLATKDLEEAEIIKLESENGDREYAFKSAVMHETIYNTILKKKRLNLHENIGEYIERNYSDRIDEYTEILAHHFGHSDKKEAALDYLIKAAVKAKNQYANSQALKYYNNALDICKMLYEVDTSDEQVNIYIDLADISSLNGEYSQALDQYNYATEILKLKNAPTPKLAEIFQLRGNVYSFINDYDRAFEMLKKAEDEIQKHDNPELNIIKARIYDVFGWIYYKQSKYSEAEDAGRKSLSILEKTDNLGDISKAYNLLGVVDYDVGKWDSAIKYFNNAKSICEEINNLRGISACLNNLALIYQNRGEYPIALKCSKQSYDIAKNIGDTYGKSITLGNIGGIYYYTKQGKKAENTLKEALDIAKNIEADDILPEIYCYLSLINAENGEFEVAENFINESKKISKSIESQYYEALTEKTLGEVLILRKKYKEAQSVLKKSNDMFVELGSKYEVDIVSKLLSKAISGEK